MTKHEAIKWLEYGKQGEMGKAVEAHDMAIQALQALDDIRAEINGWMKEPPRYIPNWDAYKRVLELIDRHMKGEQDADNTNS